MRFYKFNFGLLLSQLVVFFGVQHYTGHYCIAFSACAALFYLKTALEYR